VLPQGFPIYFPTKKSIHNQHSKLKQQQQGPISGGEKINIMWNWSKHSKKYYITKKHS
jgi:hypothetical protein